MYHLLQKWSLEQHIVWQTWRFQPPYELTFPSWVATFRPLLPLAFLFLNTYFTLAFVLVIHARRLSIKLLIQIQLIQRLKQSPRKIYGRSSDLIKTYDAPFFRMINDNFFCDWVTVLHNCKPTWQHFSAHVYIRLYIDTITFIDLFSWSGCNVCCMLTGDAHSLRAPVTHRNVCEFQDSQLIQLEL